MWGFESADVQKLGGLLNPCSLPEEKRVRVDNYGRNIVIAHGTLQLQELLQGPAVSGTKGFRSLALASAETMSPSCTKRNACWAPESRTTSFAPSGSGLMMTISDIGF